VHEAAAADGRAIRSRVLVRGENAIMYRPMTHVALLQIDACPAFNCAGDVQQFCPGVRTCALCAAQRLLIDQRLSCQMSDRIAVASCLRQHAKELSKECVYSVTKHAGTGALVCR
jgi:hypothetical protein